MHVRVYVCFLCLVQYDSLSWLPDIFSADVTVFLSLSIVCVAFF